MTISKSWRESMTLIKTARELHQALDLLLARYINDTGKLLGRTTIFDLMKWSHEQVLKEEGQ
jgi:hypothetical protein